MTSGTLRDDVLALRRSGLASAMPMAVATAACALLAIPGPNRVWTVWAVLLVVGGALWRVVARDARRRDAIVLARDDDAVRSYLRGRLDGQIALTSRFAPAVVAVPVTLLGLVYASDAPRHPARPLLAAQFFVFGGVLLLWTLHRRFVVHAALRRRRALLADAAPSDPPPAWLVGVAREIAAAHGDPQAALLWHEATGVKMREANVIVRNLPEPAAAEARAADVVVTGPPDGDVRARVRALRARDTLAFGVNLAILAGLFAAENWGKGGAWRSLGTGTWSDLTLAQQVYACAGGVTILGAFAQWSLHRTALTGGAASVRAYYRGQLEKRLTRVSKWSITEIVCIGLALFVAGDALARIAGDIAPDRALHAWTRVAEGALLSLWLIVMPFVTKRRARPRLQRELAELSGADAAPACR